jgi:hypothetical protein
MFVRVRAEEHFEKRGTREHPVNIRKKKIHYSFLFSVSMPRKCLAITRCKVGTTAPATAKIANRKHEVGFKTKAVFKASVMIPNRANRKPHTMPTLLAHAHLLISAFTCSRLLKGWFCKLLAMLDVTSFFSLQTSSGSNVFRFSRNLSIERLKYDDYNLHDTDYISL